MNKSLIALVLALSAQAAFAQVMPRDTFPGAPVPPLDNTRSGPGTAAEAPEGATVTGGARGEATGTASGNVNADPSGRAQGRTGGFPDLGGDSRMGATGAGSVGGASAGGSVGGAASGGSANVGGSATVGGDAAGASRAPTTEPGGVLPGVAGAVEGGAAAAGGTVGALTSSGMTDQERFARYDQNRDGFLSRAELQSNAELTYRFGKLDRNRDGKMSRQEFGERNKDLHARQE